MAPNWSALYCPICGGSVKTTIRPRSSAASAVRRKAKPAGEDTATMRRSRFSRVKRKERRRSEAAEERKPSILGPHFPPMSPTWFLVQNVATIGMRGTLWLYRHIVPLRTMSAPEERLPQRTVYLWLTPYLCALLCAALIVWGFFVSTGDEGTFVTSYPVAAIGCMLVSVLVNRYILLWSRRVIVDYASSNVPETIRFRAREFAPSSVLLWFLGAIYLQAHINRLARKKGARENAPATGPDFFRQQSNS